MSPGINAAGWSNTKFGRLVASVGVCLEFMKKPLVAMCNGWNLMDERIKRLNVRFNRRCYNVEIWNIAMLGYFISRFQMCTTREDWNPSGAMVEIAAKQQLVHPWHATWRCPRFWCFGWVLSDEHFFAEWSDRKSSDPPLFAVFEQCHQETLKLNYT